MSDHWRSDLWPPARPVPALAPDEVHLWGAALDVPPAALARFEQTLAADELARAERLRTPQLRARFVAGRGLLRAILGIYAGLPPAELRFTYGERGKPDLADAGAGGLRFNLAHSGGLALLGVARGRAIGVDVEEVSAMPDLPRVAERFFAPEERAALLALPADERAGAFFDCWTRKEAFIKATGLGLAQPLDSFAVSLGPREPARLLLVRGEPGAPARWDMRAPTAPPGFRAAVVAEGQGWELRCWRYAPDGM